MGLFEKLFPRYAAMKQAKGYFKTLTAYQPMFTSWSGAIYESGLVRSAIDAKARHISKLSVTITGTAQRALQARMKIAPNEFQTWSQYLYRLSTILENQNTAFLVPVFNEYGEITGTFPVLPSRCEIVQVDRVPYLQYTFQTGEKAAIELSLCGIMTKFQYRDDFFGESNGALIPTMDLIHAQNQGITEGIKNGATFRFMAQLANYATDEDVANEQKRFNKYMLAQENGGGMLLVPYGYNNVQQINSKPFVPDADQMKAIEKNVFDYFGVNEKILQNCATDEEMDSFFNGAVEPFMIQLAEVLSKMLFTPRELAVGNKVLVTANRLQYMSIAHKITLAQQMGDRGMITINEVRELLNYPPLEDGDKAPIRGEYYFTSDKKENDDGDT